MVGNLLDTLKLEQHADNSSLCLHLALLSLSLINSIQLICNR